MSTLSVRNSLPACFAKTILPATERPLPSPHTHTYSHTPRPHPLVCSGNPRKTYYARHYSSQEVIIRDIKIPKPSLSVGRGFSPQHHRPATGKTHIGFISPLLQSSNVNSIPPLHVANSLLSHFTWNLKLCIKIHSIIHNHLSVGLTEYVGLYVGCNWILPTKFQWVFDRQKLPNYLTNRGIKTYNFRGN